MSTWWEGASTVRNLLSAGLFRLVRCKVFWLCCAVMAGLETAAMLSLSRQALEAAYFAGINSIDSGYFIFPALVGFLSALVCAFFIGPEYGDGAMRNKIVTGCKRRDVYLSNLLLSCLASLVMCLAAIVPALSLGLPLLGGFRMGAQRAAFTTLGILALALAYAAIFTLLVMLIDNRTVSSVAALVLALLFLVAGTYFYNKLNAPPTVQGYELSINGELVETEPTPNPAYVPEGPVREVYEFLDTFLPGGQSIHYCDLSADHVEDMIVCDAVIFLLTTAAGLALFRRKDLK